MLYNREVETNEYAAALIRARLELGERIKERQGLEIKIRRLTRAIAELAALCEEPSPSFDWAAYLLTPGEPGALDLGLTDAIRAIFSIWQEESFDAADIKDLLDARAFDWSSYSQPLSAIHTVLKRLAENGTLSSEAEGEKTIYKWKGAALRRYLRRSPVSKTGPTVDRKEMAERGRPGPSERTEGALARAAREAGRKLVK
jgi:hypothetical protein